MSSDAAAMSPDAPLFLTHAIVRTDSLATIAVKYGVTIRDVKRANGGDHGRDAARARVRADTQDRARGGRACPGRGLSGAARPKTGSAALEEMREYYGTSTASSGRAAGARDGARLGTSRAFAGGTQVASKLTRVGETRGAALNEAPSSGGADESPTSRVGGGGGGGGVAASTFQSRDRA